MRFTCELRAEDLRVVQQISPQQLHLRDPSHVLQQTDQVSADDQALHELRRDASSSHCTQHSTGPCISLPPHLLPQHADAEVHFLLTQRQQVGSSVVHDEAQVGVD